MAKKDEEEKKTVEAPKVDSGPQGEGRPVEALAGEKSLLDRLKEERERKAKRLKEITGK